MGAITFVRELVGDNEYVWSMLVPMNSVAIDSTIVVSILPLVESVGNPMGLDFTIAVDKEVRGKAVEGEGRCRDDVTRVVMELSGTLRTISLLVLLVVVLILGLADDVLRDDDDDDDDGWGWIVEVA